MNHRSSLDLAIYFLLILIVVIGGAAWLFLRNRPRITIDEIARYYRAFYLRHVKLRRFLPAWRVYVKLSQSAAYGKTPVQAAGYLRSLDLVVMSATAGTGVKLHYDAATDEWVAPYPDAPYNLLDSDHELYEATDADDYERMYHKAKYPYLYRDDYYVRWLDEWRIGSQDIEDARLDDLDEIALDTVAYERAIIETVAELERYANYYRTREGVTQ